MSKRNNSLDLLKILCIIGIIFYHYCLHGGLFKMYNDLTIQNKLVSLIGMGCGKVCSDIFVIITGYFMFKSNFKLQKVIKICIDFVFYSLIVNIFVVIFFKDFTYLGKIMTLVYIATIGGFFQKYDFRIFDQKKYDIIMFISVFIFCLTLPSIELLSDNFLFTIILAVLVFDLFIKIDINESKIITFFSNASLAILLISDNSVFNKVVWFKIFNTLNYTNSKSIILILHIIKCIIIFVLLGAILEYIKNKLLNKFVKKIEKNELIMHYNKLMSNDEA